MAGGFPEPLAPMLPVLSYQGWSRSVERTSSVFLTEDCCFLHGARYALLTGSRGMGVSTGDHVLLPAYHCYSIVEPFVQLGCQVEFYKLNPDLSIDLTDLTSRLRTTTRVVLITHFFAVPQPMEPLLEVLQNSQALLIEDCAHAFWGQALGRPLGSFGAFSVASGKKFFPFEDGGILKFNRQPKQPVLTNENPAIHNLKLLVNSLEKSAQYGRLKPLSSIVRCLTEIRKRLKSGPAVRLSTADKETDSMDDAQNYIDQDLIDRSGSGVSHWLMLHTDLEHLRKRRKENFRYLYSKLNQLENFQPLYQGLPDSTVPYAFPLLLSNPQKQFPLLKNSGIPMWRWEDVELSHCSVSRDYRERLIQLPCHQGMKKKELDGILSIFCSELF